MAILTNVVSKAKKGLVKAADAGGNVVAKASGLTSKQLQDIEERRKKYLSEKPEIDPERIVRSLGAYSIEAYEAYLPQISKIYSPIALETEGADDAISLNNRIQYFEITKWVTDPTEDNQDKLINMYHVLCEEECNIALVYSRKKSGVRVYLAIVNNEEEDISATAIAWMERLGSSLSGNFPGVEINKKNKTTFYAGPLPDLQDSNIEVSVAAVSNIASEKSEKFLSQSIEKLLDGIVPESADQEYTIVLLATPVINQLRKKMALSQLYSQLMPYSQWSTSFTYSENMSIGSSATFGANLGGSAGKQVSDTDTKGTSSSEATGESEAQTHSNATADSTNEMDSTGGGSSNTIGESYGESDMSSNSVADGTSNSETDTIQAGVGVGVNGGLAGAIGNKLASFGLNINGHVDTSHAEQEGTSHTETKAESHTKSTNKSESRTETQNHSHSEGKSRTKTSSDALTRAKNKVDTIGKMSQKAHSIGHSLGINFGVNFARSSNVQVIMGKNDQLSQNFVNYGTQNTLKMIEKQIKRIEESTALGMWDFAAYVISPSPVIANNAAHMYLALTQGEESYLSQSAVNLWVANKDNKKDIKNILEFLKRLQHPEFALNSPETIVGVDSEEEIDPEDADVTGWLLYPPHVNATVSLTGRELAYAMNLPRKSVSGLPVLESVAFGREVQRFSNIDEEEKIVVGNIYHMRKVESNIRVKLDVSSLCSHTFVTGSTGTGKSNFIYKMLDEILESTEDRRRRKKFLVVEPAKGEYKNVFGGRNDVFVYGTNPAYAELLQINPFAFPEHISVLEHIDRLVEIFNACWPMYAAMPAVLKDAIEIAYKEKGWIFTDPFYYSKDFPTFMDLMEALPEVMEDSLYSSDTKSDYAGALITRVKSLTNGINGAIFCSANEIDDADLFDRNVIVDISRIGSIETKSLVMGIIIMKLQEYRMKPGVMNESLQHVTVLEEAHNLLRKTSFNQSQESSNLQGKSVEMLTNAIAEMRTYGEGFIIADQAPDLLDEAVIRNTNTKVVFRLPNESDCELVGKSIALKDEQIKELSKLPAFVAAVYQNDWIETVLCKTEKFSDISPYNYVRKDYNLPVRKLMNKIYSTNEKVSLSAEEKIFLKNWIERLENGSGTKEMLKKAIGSELTFNEKKYIAYNMFGGKRIVKVMKEADDESDGVEDVREIIVNSYHFGSTDQVVDEILLFIYRALNETKGCEEISRRYQDVWLDMNVW